MATKNPRRIVITTNSVNVENFKCYVEVATGAKELEEGNKDSVSVEWRFVTDISYCPHKEYRCEPNKDAYEFKSIGMALDLCLGIGANGACARVVLNPNWNRDFMARNPLEPTED